jgi:hypothetical protein
VSGRASSSLRDLNEGDDAKGPFSVRQQRAHTGLKGAHHTNEIYSYLQERNGFEIAYFEDTKIWYWQPSVDGMGEEHG